MSSSSKPPFHRNVPPPQGGKPASAYTRFIPREELGDFAAWKPGSFAGGAPEEPVAAPEPELPAEPSAAEWEARIAAARQAGYQDGYRDGMAALDAFKHSFAQQISAQVGTLVRNFDAELQALEAEMAQSVARIAVELARQVVRSEIEQRPELIARVAHDAVEALQLSARHVRVRVHPDDYPLVLDGAGNEMQAREAQLVPDPDVPRGGVKVDADIASVDATLAARWQQAVSAIGQKSIWEDRREVDGVGDGD